MTKTTTTMTILMTSHHDLFHGLTMTFYTLSYGPLQVDRVALWNRRFGPADLLNHWKQDFDPTGEPDLAAYWKFNEGQGDTAYDAVQGVRMSLPSTSVWSLSQAPIDDSTATQQVGTD